MKKFKKILIMGLPGSGKTTLAKKLNTKLDSIWLNADKVRKDFDDFDFSPEGRIRQAHRMKNLAEEILKEKKNAIVDFICPTKETREIFEADVTIWLDTIKSGRYDDTNKMFETPAKYDFRVKEKNAEHWSDKISNELKKE